MSNAIQGNFTVTNVSATDNADNPHPQYGPCNTFFVDTQEGITLSLRGKTANPSGKGMDGKNAHFGPGASISVFYEQNQSNGKTYNNTKASLITVMSPGQLSNPGTDFKNGGGGQPPQQQGAPQGQPAPQQQQGGGGQGQGNNHDAHSFTWPFKGQGLGFKMGRAHSGAIELYKTGKADSLQEAAKRSIQLEAYLDREYNNLYGQFVNGNQAQPPQQQPAPAPQPAPQPPQQSAPTYQNVNQTNGYAQQPAPPQQPQQQQPPFEDDDIPFD